ncbi:hypothetical protein [Acuticoccus mangrovi]|uniref:Uncharacterized protein n=1 Tax=Acuticoccus mangrovi TaxID=2796142 RepID=A0A934MD82_9HYPH|nr:hypothetical protein [Acuticoccus mangrovi]MBJ3776067.1 hypothetical protein [Acuticoccus mangrovi]
MADPLEAAISDRIAALSLADEALAADAAGTIGTAEIVRRATSREAFEGIATVPIGALALYRRLRAASALAASPVAYAAATSTDQRRMVGEVEVRTASEEGVTWLILTLAAGAVPTMMELLAADGRTARLVLDEPVDGVIQMGLAAADPISAPAVALLQHPSTAIFLI